MQNINKPLVITISIIVVVLIIAYFIYSKQKQATVAAETVKVNAEIILEAKKNLPESVARLNAEIAELELCKKSAFDESGNVGATSGRSGATGVLKSLSALGNCYTKHPELYKLLVQGTDYLMTSEDGIDTVKRFNDAINAKKDLLIAIQK